MYDSNDKVDLLTLEVSSQNREDMEIDLEEFPAADDLTVLEDQDELALRALHADQWSQQDLFDASKLLDVVNQLSPGSSSGQPEGHLDYLSEFWAGVQVDAEEVALARDSASPQWGPRSPPPPEPMVQVEAGDTMREAQPAASVNRERIAR